MMSDGNMLVSQSATVTYFSEHKLYFRLIKEEIIKKDDVVVGILTGRQKDAMLPVDYHNNSENQFAKPPKN